MEDLKDKFARSFAKITEAMAALKRGHMVIMTDDDDRENEGDLIFSADFVTPEKINFMAKEARGLICLSLTDQTVDRLELPLMSTLNNNHPKLQTAFTVSIEAAEGVTTGISASDRARTIQTAVSADSRPEDLVVPGHIFPLKANPKGVYARPGHTEGSINLMELAGLKPAAVICEILKNNGELARRPELEEFAEGYQIPLMSIEDLLLVKLLTESVLSSLKTESSSYSEKGIRSELFVSKVDDMSFAVAYKNIDAKEANLKVKVAEEEVALAEDILEELPEYEDSLECNTIYIFPCSSKRSAQNQHRKTKINGFTGAILKELGLYQKSWLIDSEFGSLTNLQRKTVVATQKPN